MSRGALAPRPGTRAHRATSARSGAVTAPRGALGAAHVAWLAAVPVAGLVLLAVLVLGAPLGELLFSSQRVTFWPSTPKLLIQPEPTEQARFLIALTAPLLLAGATVALVRRGAPRLRPATAARLVQAVQLAAVGFVVVCVIAQRQVTFGPAFNGGGPKFTHQQYFTSATLVFALAVAIGLAAAVRDRRVSARFGAWAADSRGRAAAATAVAVVAIAIWLLHAINFEQTIATADHSVAYHVQFTLDEAFAVLDGRSPLVDFVTQYGALWTYLVAAVMSVLGKTVDVFTVTMCAITGLALLAVFALLRRVTRSPLAGLLLFLPFLATTLFMMHGSLTIRYTLATFPGSYPLRFAGVWLLAWLTARQLDGAAPRRLWLLFLAAGLVVLNNTDHGIPALVAVVAALLWAQGRPSRASLTRLALALGAGLAAAFALVTLLTLLRAGSLPHPELLLRYARLFAGAGFAMLPMPTLGFHLVIYLTFVAALGVATVRALDGEPDRLLTGMLAWTGIFGLGAGSYYVGRSHPEVLVASFSVWALAVALLLLVVVRRLAERPPAWPAPAAFACMVGFGVTIASLAQTPAPWSQIERLQFMAPAYLRTPAGQSFVAAHTRPGERVAILIMLGHRTAENVGVTNVAPYTGSPSMSTVEQYEETVRELRDAGGRKLFLRGEETEPEAFDWLRRNGFAVAAQNPRSGMLLLVDRAG